MVLVAERADSSPPAALPVESGMVFEVPRKDPSSFPPPSSETTEIHDTIQTPGMPFQPTDSGEVPEHAGCWVLYANRNAQLQTQLNHSNTEPRTLVPHRNFGSIAWAKVLETPNVGIGSYRGPTTTWRPTTSTTERRTRGPQPHTDSFQKSI